MKIKLTLLLTACFFPFVSQSQFKDAVIPAYSYGINPVFSENTGNDIMDLAGQTYEVSVSDDPNGNNAMLYWKVGSVIGFAPIGSGISVKDPDVCLVNNASGILYAVAVYFDVTSNEFMWQIFQWSVAQQQFTSSAPVTLAPGIYNTSINI